MAHEKWSLIKQQKGFYTRAYRSVGTLIMLSLVVSVVLLVMIIKLYLARPEPVFYATSGATPPIELTPMDEPNETAVALLPNDPLNDESTKYIPE